MAQQLVPLLALLLGSAFLLMAGGINALVLPLRGSGEGFSTFALGLLGTGWAVGYVLGCLYTPRLVRRVGHIRAFSVLAATAGLAVLSSLILMTPYAWVPLRAVSGFSFAGAAMIVESWMSERTSPQNRGQTFAVYTMVNLSATMLGQMSLAFGDPMTATFFALAAMLYLLALIPTALTTSATPGPLVQVRLDLAGLYRNSPIAVVAVFFVGVSNSSFGTLAAIYAQGIGLDIALIALFTSLPILAGAIAQVPVGMLSDRLDRRTVIVGIAAAAIVADLMFLLVPPGSIGMTLAVATLFGATIFSMYPVLIAHANDHASPDKYILTSGGLLLVFGLGSIVGPFAAGLLMELTSVRALFFITALAHALIMGYAIWRISQRAAVSSIDKVIFIPAPVPRNSTPQTAVLSPQAPSSDLRSDEPAARDSTDRDDAVDRDAGDEAAAHGQARDRSGAPGL
ncbi:MAG: MFS transporter [Hyphomicrobiaceae bacterium]